jgi:hypothetical protein
MAGATYKVKRGDNLTKICDGRCGKDVAAAISGITVKAKIATVAKLNNIKDINKIYVNQILKLNESGSSGGSSATATSSKTVKITGLGLQSEDKTGRELIAVWEWTKDNTAGYKIHWTYFNPMQGAGWVLGSETEVDGYGSLHHQATYSAPDYATQAAVKIRPYYKEKDKNNNEVIKYWKDIDFCKEQYYDFSNNNPLPPPTPADPVIDDLTLTVRIDEIVADDLDAASVKFNVVKDNKSSVYTSPAVPITKAANYVSHICTKKLEYGSLYKVRACSVNAKGKESGWSSFSGNVGTKPSAPKSITSCYASKKSDGSTSVHLEWDPVTTATGYIVEYTTREDYFDNPTGDVTEVPIEDKKTSVDINNITIGTTYYFRVRATREVEEGTTVENSDPSPVVSLPVGTQPAAPTTWSTAKSAFANEMMELNWTHNSSDGSRQTRAQLKLKINDVEKGPYIFQNVTTETDENEVEAPGSETCPYGTAISYKGVLRFILDTNHEALQDAKIEWQVQTAGITGSFTNNSIYWSVPRTIYIYEKPTLEMSMVTDLADPNGTIIENLESFPFYIRAHVALNSYKVQRPIGYHLQVVANDFYETIDDTGRTKTVNIGDAVYSKYFDTGETLIVEMSANNIDLVSNIPYTVYCAANMSSGLTVQSDPYSFSVDWIDLDYNLDADITVDMESYTAVITPYCSVLEPISYEDGMEVAIGNRYTDGNDVYQCTRSGVPGSILDTDYLTLETITPNVENVTLSVYRREYDGTFTEIATGIPNNSTSVTDPHPALDYARYRIVATDTLTGAISFYDMAGYPVSCSSIIIQWDEEWSTYNVSDEYMLDGPDWSGSLLKLDYNVEVSDNRKREVELIKYVGREHPVSYYGTQRDETSSWKVVIPKNDVETIYALRRLSIWSGDVYVREPSGMGYWASIGVSFDQKYDDITIPITIDITRVEGGM